jgi:hypothetical protein
MDEQFRVTIKLSRWRAKKDAPSASWLRSNIYFAKQFDILLLSELAVGNLPADRQVN